ncbi:MAG TPA: HDOD domain-containing protein [Malonomonas sp.]
MTAEDIIKGMHNLVSLPDAVLRANELLNSPTANAREIGEVINHDPALAARLLKLVNSAFYSFPAQVDTVSRAITLIGTDELRSLLMAATVTQAFDDIPAEMINMDSFWHRSVYCGLVAKKLALLNQGGKGESMFLSGLLHDVGRLVLISSLPNQAKEIFQRAEETGQSFNEVTTQRLGFGSAELGAALLESWQLPKNLWQPVRYQNQPESADDYSAEANILNLALRLTDCVEPELKDGKQQNLETLEATKLNGMELTGEELGLLAMDANLECFEVLVIINPKATLIY